MRRGIHLVGDIELVAIPKITSYGLFADQQRSALDTIIADMTFEGHLESHKNGPKYKQFTLSSLRPPIKLDLFLANEDNWGLILALRTGPAAFSKRMVTQRFKGGLLNTGYHIKDGFVWSGGHHKVQMKTEANFMSLLSCGWVDPGDRK